MRQTEKVEHMTVTESRLGVHRCASGYLNVSEKLVIRLGIAKSFESSFNSWSRKTLSQNVIEVIEIHLIIC
jgi:ABC-type histidine transport system ATPase subunit